jgi:3-methyl-2-oxobutanoate hydroxymethyltransferase
MNLVTTRSLQKMKRSGEKITMLTAYDHPTAMALDEAGIDVALVGDSLGMVVLGYDSTLPVTLEDMIHHSKAVGRGLKRALLVVDMPFLSYQESPQAALRSAGRIVKETGAQAVKLEGGREVAATLRFLRQAGIAVMGHVGLVPQSVHALGGYRVQGRERQDAVRLLADAKALEKAGAFAVVLESIPSTLAARITRSLKVPTIGIGAGKGCDGQVLVSHDLLGFSPGHRPRFAKAYADFYGRMKQAFSAYGREVRSGSFPDPEHTPA